MFNRVIGGEEMRDIVWVRGVVESCEKVRKGCWKLQLHMSWQANGGCFHSMQTDVEVNRPWPIGEVMEFRLGDGLPEVRLTAEPEEL